MRARIEELCGQLPAEMTRWGVRSAGAAAEAEQPSDLVLGRTKHCNAFGNAALRKESQDLKKQEPPCLVPLGGVSLVSEVLPQSSGGPWWQERGWVSLSCLHSYCSLFFFFPQILLFSSNLS